MNEIMNYLASFFAAGLAAVFTQNAVLGRGFGFENLIREEEPLQRRTFRRLQAVCCLLSACGFWAVRRWILPRLQLLRVFASDYYAQVYLWPVAMALVLCAVYLLLFVCTVKLAREQKVKGALDRLPFACFNTFTAGVLLVNGAKDHSFPEMLGFTLGSFLGYMLADFLMQEGIKKLKRSNVPEAFRGLPALLIYLAGLVLAAYSLIGHKLSALL